LQSRVPETLILLGERMDPLWRGYLPQVVKGNPITVTADTTGRGGFPHNNDIVGWRRWLGAKGIKQLHYFQPDAGSFGILTAARLSAIEITIHITGQVDRNIQRIVKLFRGGNGICGLRARGKTIRFQCAGKFCAEQLRRLGVREEIISVWLPEVEVQPINEARRSQLRNSINPTGPVILVMARPGDGQGLKGALWSGALVKHIFYDTKLVVAGACTDRQARDLSEKEDVWDSKGMIHIDNEEHSWDELVGASDVVLAGTGPFHDVIRLLHARAARAKIIAGVGAASEFLSDYEYAQIVIPNQPRQLAGAILSILEKSDTRSTTEILK